MGFLCVVCNVNKRATSKKIKKFKLCTNCYHEINNDYHRTKTNIKKHHTKCVICGADLDHYNNYSTCKVGGCRFVHYQNEQRRIKIRYFIKTQKLNGIANMKVGKIVGLGFEMILKEKEAVA